MIDHVEVDLRGTLLAVRDQGARPTCLAHAVTAAHEHARGAPTHLSAEYLHFFASQGTAPGSSMNEASEALKVEGQSVENHCPHFLQDPPSGWKPPTGLAVFRRGSEPQNANSATVEYWVRSGRAPVLGLTLPQSFFDPNAPWVVPSDGPLRGLHAVAGVGLGRHQGTRVFLIRNSWGSDWGDGGYAWLDDEFLGRHLKAVLVLTDEVSP